MAHRYFLSILFIVFGCFFCSITTRAQVNKEAPKDSLQIYPASRQRINPDTLDADARNEIEAERKRLALPASRQRINPDTLDADARNEINSLPFSEGKHLSDNARSDNAQVVLACDLDITSITLSPNPVTEDQNETISALATNNGTSTCTSGEQLEYYLSTNSFLSTSDILVGTRTITATLGSGAGVYEDLTFKPQDQGITAGTYWVGVRIVSEDEFWVLIGTLTIDPAPSGSCNLDITSIGLSSNPVAEDQNLTITANTINNGTAHCSSEKIEYYLSTNSTLTTSDILVGDDLESLDPGISDSEDITFKPKDQGIAAGTYWIGIRVVSENQFFVGSSTLTISSSTSETISVSLPNLTCDIDGDLTIPISINDDLTGLNIIAYDFSISFDDHIIDLTGTSSTGTLSDAWTVSSNTAIPGSITVSAASSTDLAGSGDLILLTGKCFSEGTSPLTWISFTFNEGTPIASTTDGSVDVSSSCPICGDVSGNGSVSAFDAGLILQDNVGILPPGQDYFSCAADVSGNGTITAFDAAQVLQFNVGIISELSCSESASKSITSPHWGEPAIGIPEFNQQTNESSLPVTINPKTNDLVSLQGTFYLGDKGNSFIAISKDGLPEGWMVMHRIQRDTLHFSMAGSTPLSNESFFELVFSSPQMSMTGPLSLSLWGNEYEPIRLEQDDIGGAIPTSFKLFQNYPNPFNPSTNISFLLPENEKVTLGIFDLLGRRIRFLINNEEMQPGKHSVVFRADDLSSGIYIYRITAGKYRAHRMFILQK
ncbi:T9SS type A sorting domain-containing protein [Rhodocaloribacter sp.]